MTRNFRPKKSNFKKFDKYKTKGKRFDSKGGKREKNRGNNGQGGDFGVFKVRYDEDFGKGTFDKLNGVAREVGEYSFIRVNLSKTTVEEVVEFLKKNRIAYINTFLSNAFRIKRSFFNLSSSILSLTSKVYFQDLASQVPVNLIDFERLVTLGRRVRVLDMAASPGSKTTQVLDLLEFKRINYEVVCLEPNKIRLNRLINNIQKASFGLGAEDEIKVFNIEGEKFSSKEKFDVILLDAPCSGNMVGDSSWLKKRDIGGIERSASLQKKLLRSASGLLAKGGELIYSTCSLELEENEMNVDWASRKLGLKVKKKEFDFGFRARSVEFVLGQENRKGNIEIGMNVLSRSYRLMPYVSRTQGFFVCILEK